MLDEINAEIERLLQQPVSYQLVSKLADLYIVRDHLQPSCEGDAEFLKMCSGKPVSEVFAVIDELMEAVKISNSRLYECVQRKLTSI